MLRQCASLPRLKNNNNDNNVIRDSCQTVKWPVEYLRKQFFITDAHIDRRDSASFTKIPFLVFTVLSCFFKLVTMPTDIFISVYMEKPVVPED